MRFPRHNMHWSFCPNLVEWPLQERFFYSRNMTPLTTSFYCQFMSHCWYVVIILYIKILAPFFLYCQNTFSYRSIEDKREAAGRDTLSKILLLLGHSPMHQLNLLLQVTSPTVKDSQFMIPIYKLVYVIIIMIRFVARTYPPSWVLKAQIQKHRGKPLLFHDMCPGFFYMHYTTHRTYSFTSHPKDEAIMVKCLAQGHKRRDRPGQDSNPHSGNTRTWVQCTRPLWYWNDGHALPHPRQHTLEVMATLE